tara:strand:- start:2676 stop:3230 length:555 start_codon:yes stop_codon:yes gene_type:complete
MTKMFQPFAEFASIDILDEDLKGITKFCNQTQKNFPSVIKSNSGGYQSSSLFHPTLDKNKPMWNLFSTITKKIANLHRQNELSLPLRLDNFWININKKTHFNVPHSHPCCIFSGVFYVKTPYNSGNFAFYRNIHVYKSTELIKPEENMLILFPAYFDHYVEPNNSNQDRISISFNYIKNNEPQS